LLKSSSSFYKGVYKQDTTMPSAGPKLLSG
jgi:hypothetical protein